ncbi:MAG: hypothetical protein LC734_09505 [Acidobacteria bacterium]|nr:hypothetical protein [Acidobacteriota bacterium]
MPAIEPYTNSLCPRCQASRLLDWTELTGEEKFLAERLPASAEFTKKERKKHRYCRRCWFEESFQARLA